MMRSIAMVACLALVSVAAPFAQDPKWTTIVDGKSMGDFTRVGAANGRAEGGSIVADKLEGKDPAYLVTVVVLNGQKTVDVTDTRLPNAGNVALQYGSGSLMFRKVQIRSL